MPPRSGSPHKQRLTLAQLTAYDDILTDALIDHVCVHQLLDKSVYLKAYVHFRYIIGLPYGRIGVPIMRLEVLGKKM